MNMTDDFIEQVNAEHYWQAGEKVVIGVSGGVDSMVLFDMLNQLPVELKPTIIVAHVNHHLRSESDEEEQFVKKWMKNHEVPVHIHQWPEMEHPQAGVEQEARKVRYQFFADVAERTGSTYILTAHHRDDQVETVLMRFVKGSSLNELKGIATTRNAQKKVLLRLLLPYSKEMILDYAEGNDISWREDESNQSMAYTRNRYRHRIIPELKKENPAFEQSVFDFAEDLKDLLDTVEPLVDEELTRSFHFNTGRVVIDLTSFLKQKSGFQKIVLRQALKQLSGQGAYIISQAHISLLIEWFASGGPNTTLDLPNPFVALKEYDTCTIQRVEGLQSEAIEQANEKNIMKYNQWTILNSEERIGCFSFEAFQQMNDREGCVIYIHEQHIQWPLMIRHRKPGDRMKIKGLDGSKKIKDIFIDQKVPKQKRDEAWLITDNNGQIIWLLNYKESPLSLNPLTDTISYVLVYQKRTMQD